ncbi:hypothetical protein O3M35_008738 [Rhynocoris fuscipes]|uniref:CUB domain-containing protein n=1 Tax=Rhynocoris fuscipes TaxID=488301 RepID=A0AAW1D8L5_9HEMI
MGLDRKYTRQCGHINSGMVVESERKFFRVTFRSNDRLDATGFNATYQFVEPPTRPPAIITARSSGIRCMYLFVNYFWYAYFYSKITGTFNTKPYDTYCTNYGTYINYGW